MKTRLIILVLLIVSFSCGTNNKPVPDAQKEKMIAEVRKVGNDINKALEEVNFDVANEPCLDSPDFSYTSNGITMNYNEFMGFKTDFEKRLNQKFTLLSEKYVVLDKTTVISTSNCKWLINYKDGHSLLLDPWVVQATFKRIDNKWRVINLVECGVEQNVKNIETSKELNQVELMKQFIGSWKYDYSKDTIGYLDTKSYGAGIEGYFKNITKGKVIMEGKQLWGYDNKTDKIIHSQLVKGRDIKFYVYNFISKNKFEIIRHRDITNPEKASWKAVGEFKTPDLWVQTTIENSKPLKTMNFTRVKQ